MLRDLPVAWLLGALLLGALLGLLVGCEGLAEFLPTDPDCGPRGCL